MIDRPHEPRYAMLPSPLLESKAFEVVHAEPAREGELGRTREVVLLERTGLAPRVLPTQINAKTVRSIKRCERAKGPGSAEGMKSRFPNGIMSPKEMVSVPD